MIAGALPASAGAESASQPASAAAGRLDVSGGGDSSGHSCAVLPDAAVRCWGFGGAGRLGYGSESTIGDDETPSGAGPVDLGPGRTAAAIAVGAFHSCALLDGGDVRCWGFGGEGRLGYANMQSVGDDEAPGAAGPVDLGPGRTARAITAGGGHTCALLDDGNVRCWGFGSDGRLGYGSPSAIGDDEIPGSVGPVDLGAGRTAVAISAGESQTCAVLDDGSVRCWGFAGVGQLGYANTTTIGDTESPGSAGPVDLGPGRTAVAIGAGDAHTCALLDDGSVRCRGYGADGRLGYANTNHVGDDEAPAAVGPVDLGAGRTAVAISAGGDHTCARLDDGSVRCWGGGALGRLGYCNVNAIGDDEPPASAGPVDLGAPASPGAGCVAPAPTPASESPTPPAATPSPFGPATPNPVGKFPFDPLGWEVERAAKLRRCRADAAQPERSAARRRRRCVRRFSRTPGRVRTLRARTAAKARIVLRFRAPGSDGGVQPAARGYLIKQAMHRIRSRRDFKRAHPLCKGTCRFPVTNLGSRIRLRVTGLRRHQTYFYAVAARDNVTGRRGPRSRTVRARTR